MVAVLEMIPTSWVMSLSSGALAMWVKRTAGEEARWHEITRREARWNARGIALFILLGALLAPLGWTFHPRFGAFVQHRHRTAWATPPFVLLGLGSAIALGFYRWQFRRELSNAPQRSICPQHGTMGESPAGSACRDGGQFVPQSTMKWVDDNV